jgi:L-cysteate sulfo-lyase
VATSRLVLPDLPRVRLLDGPTPLQPMPRLAEALGGRTDLWIKREDAGVFPFSGNKLRNLEFVLGEAIAIGSDAIVTSGRRWSNHCRLTAAAGARLGLEVHLVLSGPPERSSANVALIELFGGVVHEVATEERAERDATVERVAADLRAQGRHVTVVPVGGSGAVGAWGQVLAALEAVQQAEGLGFMPDVIVLPSASGGTQAGLVTGAEIATRGRMRIVGVLTARPEVELRPIVERLVRDVATLARIDAPAASIEMDASQLGAGYGIPSPESEDAGRLLARTEGLLVDPVYTAKGLAGLIALVRSGAVDGRRVVFWHGGGLPALFEPAAVP